MHTTISLLLASASLLASVSTAHSWLECTDYRMTDGSADSKVWNNAVCFGRARCGKRQAEAGFGMDTGFNYHSSSGCQCARGSDNYEGVTKATYTPGQRVCVAYPPKNHVAAPCTNAYIPDAGTVITRTAVNPTSDAASSFVKDYGHRNGQHTKGSVDYKGFQHCPNFCADKEKALCTMCFDLEQDIVPGEYSFKWMWSFNSEQDTYSTCWEANVTGEKTVVVPLAVAVPASTTTPSVAPSSPAGPSVTESGEEEEDCNESLPEPSDEEEECEESLPQPKEEEEEEEECEESLPQPTDPVNNGAYNRPASPPAPVPATLVPAPVPTFESAEWKTETPETVSAQGGRKPDVLCSVEDDEQLTQAVEGPGTVQAYSDGE